MEFGGSGALVAYTATSMDQLHTAKKNDIMAGRLSATGRMRHPLMPLASLDHHPFIVSKS
jgi:hypothetical protein